MPGSYAWQDSSDSIVTANMTFLTGVLLHLVEFLSFFHVVPKISLLLAVPIYYLVFNVEKGRDNLNTLLSVVK